MRGFTVYTYNIYVKIMFLQNFTFSIYVCLIFYRYVQLFKLEKQVTKFEIKSVAEYLQQIDRV